MKINNDNIKSPLEIRLLELTRLRIAYINKCQFSIDLHYNELRNFGETNHRLLLVSVWEQVPHFSKKECALFALTDYVISPINNEEFENIYTLLEPHFSENQIIALTQAIRQIDIWTRSIKYTNELCCPGKKP